MRVVLIIDWFLYYTVELANALSREHNVMLMTRDHNYEISSPDNPKNLDEFLDECLMKKIVRARLRYRRGDMKNCFEVLRVYKTIKAFDPDVIHIQENTDWRILLIAKMLGFDRLILTIHDVVRHPGEAGRIAGYLESILRKKARKLIVHGDFLKKQLVSRSESLEKKTHVVPHGAFSIYKKWDDTSVKEEENAILFFGRISKYKGVDVLMRAVPFITKEIPGAKIIIAGRGEEFSKYENLITNKSQFEIHNRFISNAEVPKFFRRASVVVLPYTEASQSGVIPIAYAFRKPIVVSNVGSIPEVVEEGKTGFIVPPNSPEYLADAIVKILKDQELKRTMGQNAFEKTLSKLSWGAIAEKTVQIYSSIK